MPTSILRGWADWPAPLGGLLPEVLPRLQIQGVPVKHWLDPYPGRRYRLGIELDVTVDHSFAGELRETTFQTDGGQLAIPATDGLAERLLLPTMPWLSAVRLSPELGPGEAEVLLTVEGLRFDVLSGEEFEADRIAIAMPPLEVRLSEPLEEAIHGGREGAGGGWIQWAPGRIVYGLDRGRAKFESVELPLDSEESALMTGSSEGGEFDLSGSVEQRLLPGLLNPTGDLSESISLTFTSKGGPVDIRLSLIDLGKFLEADKLPFVGGR